MAEKTNILIVSDLHLSRGYYAPETEGVYGGRFSNLEDMFHDEAFFDFVVHHVTQGGKWQIVLNGDIVDFLQVVDWPTDRETLAELRQVLHEGDDWSTWRAQKRKYGLGTTYIETCWKLTQVAAGHPVFFQALALVLATGNQVILIKGNHDPEWHWPQVQTRMRELVREAYDPEQIGRRLSARDERLNRRTPLSLDDRALRRLIFCPRFYYVKGLLYVEHGCQYEVTNSFPDFLDPVLPTDRNLEPEKRRIELPFGSFFVRYFFNLVEQATPFADNIKPLTRYLAWVFRRHPLWAIEFLLTRGDVLREIYRRMRQIHADRVFDQAPRRAQMARRARTAESAEYWHGPEPLPDPAKFLRELVDVEAEVFKSHPPLLYLKPARWLAAASAYDPGFLYHAAVEIRRLLRQQGADVQYVVMGHNHRADVLPLGGGAWYCNSGTWTLIAGDETRLFRETREFTYVKITAQAESRHTGQQGQAELLRWNDDASRGERVILMPDSFPHRSKRRVWSAVLLAGGLSLLALFLRRMLRKE